MVKISIKHVVKDVDRFGNVRYYFRRKGFAKVRLKGVPGSREFMDQYNEALAGRGDTDRMAKQDPKSFEYLCKTYYNSTPFRSLSKSTQSWRYRELQVISKKHGSKPFSKLTAVNVRQLVDERQDRPGAARNRLKALKALFRWALEYGLVTSDPTQGVRLKSTHSDGFHTWTNEEIRTFEQHFPVGSKARLAFGLLLYTACRRGDVVRLGPKHIGNGRLSYRQNKNAKRNPVDVSIPVHAELMKLITHTECGPFTYLVTEFGRPFSVAGFGNRFREWCNEAGLSNCSAHGLRKAAAVRLAEAGATPHEIMAVTGHRSLAEVERYTREANMRNLSDAAISKIR